MSIRKIIEYPDPLLKEIAAEVREIGPEIKQIVADMFDTLKAAPGIGLAAPQIAVSKRIIVVDVSHYNPEVPPRALVNPKILRAEGTISMEEGCLSVPDFYVEVERSEKIRVAALDGESGEAIQIDAEGLHAVVMQHEIDHLNGILLTDHVSRLKRGIYHAKLKRKRDENKSGSRAPAGM